MDTKELIKKLTDATGLDEKMAAKAADIFTKNPLVGKDTKQTIVKLLQEKLGLDAKKAEGVYDKAAKILAETVMGKVKLPFDLK